MVSLKVLHKDTKKNPQFQILIFYITCKLGSELTPHTPPSTP